MTALLIVLASSFLACLLLAPLVKLLAVRCGLVDHPDARRKLHGKPIPLAGGIALLLAGVGVLVGVRLIPGPLGEALAGDAVLPGLLAACVVICGVGVVDDKVRLRGRHKALGQLVAVIILLGSGVVVRHFSLFGWEVELGVMAAPFTAFWLLGAINSLNLLDGMDGLLSSVGLIIALAMAVMAVLGGHWAAAAVAAALAGGLLGFLPYNFPPASSFLGDAGSMLIGLVIGVLAIRSSVKGPATVALAAPLGVLTLPIFDTGAAIVRRKLTGRSVFATDRGHLHHRLLGRGMTPRGVLFWVCVFCLLTAAGALGSVAFQDELLAVTTGLAVMGVLIVTRSFGDTELALVNQRLAAVVGPLWRKPADGPNRGVEVRLQGKAEWEELWGRLTWEASDLNLSTLTLDVNVPVVQEAFHGRWPQQARDGGEAADLWRLELPLVVRGQTVGRLQMTGSGEGAAGLAKLGRLARLVEAFIAGIWPEAGEVLAPYPGAGMPGAAVSMNGVGQ